MKKAIILVFVLSLFLAGCNVNLGKNLNKNKLSDKVKNITLEEAKAKTESFVNDNLMQQGRKATAKSASEEMGLYKINLSLPNNQEVVSYMTKDGKKFFPEAMDVAEIEKQVADSKNPSQAAPEASQQEPAASVTDKKDKPEVELFVMSQCPYGTQIEKGILPAVEALGNKINFKIKFCSYAMHGEKELDEQLKQYCVQKEETAKFQNYLKCYLIDGDSDRCTKAASLNDSKIKKCIASADSQYKVKEKFKDQSTWVSGRFPTFDIFKADNEKYGVQGSPTLVINGKQVSSGRNPATLLKTICSGFKNQPAECQKALSSTEPAPGFGTGEASPSAGAAGGCGN